MHGIDSRLRGNDEKECGNDGEKVREWRKKRYGNYKMGRKNDIMNYRNDERANYCISHGTWKRTEGIFSVLPRCERNDGKNFTVCRRRFFCALLQTNSL
jgi:hypothetical protein